MKKRVNELDGELQELHKQPYIADVKEKCKVETRNWIRQGGNLMEIGGENSMVGAGRPQHKVLS